MSFHEEKRYFIWFVKKEEREREIEREREREIEREREREEYIKEKIVCMSV